VYDKLNQKLKEFENERDDINKEFDRGYNEFYDYKRQLEKEINYKNTLINHCIPQKYLEWMESLMDFDENTGEWFIANLAENMPNKESSNMDQVNLLAMGLHDDEEIFNQNLLNNDIKLSMILEMNNPPKNVYFSYEEKKT